MASFRRSLNNLRSFLHEDSINNDDSNKEEINIEEEGDGDDDTNDDKQEATDNGDNELEGEVNSSWPKPGMESARVNNVEEKCQGERKKSNVVGGLYK